MGVKERALLMDGPFNGDYIERKNNVFIRHSSWGWSRYVWDANLQCYLYRASYPTLREANRG